MIQPNPENRLPPEQLPQPPHDPLAETRYHHILLPRRSRQQKMAMRSMGFIAIALVACLLIYLLAPMRTNLLVLGIDARPGEGDVARSDTLVLSTFRPFPPYAGALSIPRDLWVDIPGVGQNRINTAHFFAEAEQPGSGPSATWQTIQANFGVSPGYYLRVRFDGFMKVVDAMGGVDVLLPRAMSGYPEGRHHLNGEQALALVRDRSGSDDFFRMERGQIFIRSILAEILQPRNWPRLPAVLVALWQAVDSDVPAWVYPRLALTLLLVGPQDIDARSITREMVHPFTTAGGANVLEPDWAAIQPLVKELFGQ
jgi:LCP family protein required for cell wall assembly